MLQGGLFIDKCSDVFAGAVKAVDETGKAGKVTITLDLKKVNGAISVLAKVTDKTPEATPDADMYLATVEGNLSIDNPNQRKLDLRVAGPGATEVRQAASPTIEIRSIDPTSGEILTA